MELKPQDVCILLKLVVSAPGWSYSRLATDLGMSPAGVHAGVKRATKAKLFDANRNKPILASLEEFLLHGVKYAFPAEPGTLTRGIPTGFSAPVLGGHFEVSKSGHMVWPSPIGEERGVAIEPLYRSIPEACLKDPKLYAALALVDALRIGRARERELAKDLLVKILRDK
jgi:hypothetical protein